MSGLMQDPRTGLMRVEPTLPPQHMDTYAVVAPRRPAFCHEAGCPSFERGWVTTVDESSELGRNQAAYIRHRSSRRFAESRTDTGLTEFAFHPGQECFAQHKLPSADETFLRHGGDWRGNPRRERQVFATPGDWVDSFANHQIKLAEQVQRG